MESKRNDNDDYGKWRKMGTCVEIVFFKQKTAYEIGTGDWSSDVALPSLFC